MNTRISNSENRKLRPEQEIAARTLNRHLSVTAGPGAGKTLVLVERYLEILQTQKVSVDNIVAITFTNRAANEMRERVRKKIDDLLRETAGDERRRWLRHKRALEGAVITTIHGFCSRLLHEFPIEANVDPQFTLLDEHQAAMMLEAVVEESLTEAIQHGSEKIVQMAQGVGRSSLAAALAELYRKYRGEGLTVSEIDSRTAANHAARDNYFAALGQLDGAMTTWSSARNLSPDADEKRIKAGQEWPALRAILAQPPTELTIAKYCQAIEDFRETRPRKGSTPGVDQFDELLWGDDSNDRLRGRVPSLGFDLLAKDYALAMLKLLRSIDERLEAEKQRMSALDFDDLQLQALKLLNGHPEVMARVTERYRFFLVDEFQDTNSLQRDLLTKLALVRGANLFIVGDRKQSIYGFRGADVDVFVEMTGAVKEAGGLEQPLNVNFRSQPGLIEALNFLFGRIFKIRPEIPSAGLIQLGHVGHEPSHAERKNEHELPLVELLVSAKPDNQRKAADESAEEGNLSHVDVRDRDARQLVERIKDLVDSGNRYGHIAILLRALTGVWTYEAALRRAEIPYLTVQGKGFYQREEIIDLIQLLRFLDNITDELALAAVLRSPLCGISDNALLALRCAPKLDQIDDSGRLRRRNLLDGLRRHREIAFIDETESPELERALLFLDSLLERRNRYSISKLLRYAASSSEFLTIIAANFDGAQRVANVEKLFRLAEQFEKSGHLIRDFVHYVEEFEAVGGREGEGQIDESANAVRLMTIHQAKGLEFPFVIIPDLHREPMRREASFILDRHRGFTARIPDGRGQTVRGALFNELRQRARWRDEFESMRLLYVAATRARDRLIFTGSVTQKELKNISKTDREQWLAWIWQALDLDENAGSGVLRFDDGAEFRVTVDRAALTNARAARGLTADSMDAADESFNPALSIDQLFPLLHPIVPERGVALRRFSVTQLINFQRCARQYYFDRLLRAPSVEERAVWNDAEAPEPPANLTATLKGAVIHRFCETFSTGDDPQSRLRSSFEDIIRQRRAELAGRAFQIDTEEAVHDLTPLAQNYLVSEVFQRVSAANRLNGESLNPQSAIRNPQSSSSGLWSELRFRLLRPLGILTGTIDKLLITPAATGNGFDIEIIDFKTNRFRSQLRRQSKQPENATAAAGSSRSPNRGRQPFPDRQVRSKPAQGYFNFEAIAEDRRDETSARVDSLSTSATSLDEQVNIVARDYQLQMQSYALALYELLGYRTRSGSDQVKQAQEAMKINRVRATLHFIDPNVEISIQPEQLEPHLCARAVDDAMLAIASLDGQLDAELFPPLPAAHCRMCNFLELCPAGKAWLRVQTGRDSDRID